MRCWQPALPPDVLLAPKQHHTLISIGRPNEEPIHNLKSSSKDTIRHGQERQLCDREPELNVALAICASPGALAKLMLHAVHSNRNSCCGSSCVCS